MQPTPTPAPGFRLDEFLSRIDRRIVYLGLFVMTLVPLVAGWRMPLYLTEPPQLLLRAIEALPEDRLVLIASDWDAGTQAENRPQHVALVRHLLRRNLRFAMISVGYPNAPQLAQDATQEAVRLENAEGRWRYGEHWVNLGFKLSEDAWLRGFANSIPESVPADWKGTPLAEIPVMEGVERFGPEGQVSMVIDITGSNTIDKWYQFLGPTKVTIGLACTSVMAPEQYPFLDSGQLVGMLTGMKGAAEYEKLLGVSAFGTTGMGGQSFAHLYIVMLILLGNVSLLSRRRRRGSAR